MSISQLCSPPCDTSIVAGFELLNCKRPHQQQIAMHRFDSSTSKLSIAELHISQTEEPMLEQEDDLFNDDAFNDTPKSKFQTSWTCVVR
jgi:hypothetical protein